MRTRYADDILTLSIVTLYTKFLCPFDRFHYEFDHGEWIVPDRNFSRSQRIIKGQRLVLIGLVREILGGKLVQSFIVDSSLLDDGADAESL